MHMYQTTILHSGIPTDEICDKYERTKCFSLIFIFNIYVCILYYLYRKEHWNWPNVCFDWEHRAVIKMHILSFSICVVSVFVCMQTQTFRSFKVIMIIRFEVILLIFSFGLVLCHYEEAPSK